MKGIWIVICQIRYESNGKLYVRKFEIFKDKSLSIAENTIFIKCT